MNEAPEWFSQAIASPSADATVSVSDCAIHYRTWGQADRPALIFIHGGGAHLHWWDFIAPFFCDEYYVGALDLGGMGDSGHRSRYSLDTFAHEVLATLDAMQSSTQALLVGHSFGGFVTLNVLARHPDRVAGAVLIDSPVRPPQKDQMQRSRGGPMGRPKRTYPDLPTALERFRLIPEQPCKNRYLLDYIAQNSIKPVDGGFTWKFDDQLFQNLERRDLSALLPQVRQPTGIVYGEKSIVVTSEIAHYMAQEMTTNPTVVAIPEAQHHVFLDQPLAVVATLRCIFSDWSRTHRP